jgi:excinuclease UvrABC helicase subunit UvrB
METSLELFEQTVDAYNSEVSDIYKFSFTAKETEMFTEMMIEFAKKYVTEALKQASEKVTMKLRDDVHELDMNDDWMEVDKKSILTAYSLDNVK